MDLRRALTPKLRTVVLLAAVMLFLVVLERFSQLGGPWSLYLPFPLVARACPAPIVVPYRCVSHPVWWGVAADFAFWILCYAGANLLLVERKS